VLSWSPVPLETCTAHGAAPWAFREVSCGVFSPKHVKLFVWLHTRFPPSVWRWVRG
jgi:hypothetical protein